ncbi:MAG: helix-turn-helix domain-containing protein [Bacteroidota bacterium]
MFQNENIKFLRNRRGRTQDEVAHTLGMKRSTLSGYENNIAQPGIEALVAFSNYFGVAIDTLIKVKLSSLSESQLSELERGFDVYITGSSLRVLATTVNSENEENIELVNQKASAGYRSGYADPEYLRVLPVFQLPFLSRDRKYRTFQISGDSMLPIPDKAYVTGEFIQNWSWLKKGDACIVLTLDDGIVFKILGNKIISGQPVWLHSLNPLYEPFNVDIKEIKEIWKFVNYISPEIPDPMNDNAGLYKTVNSLRDDVNRLMQTMSVDGHAEKSKKKNN